MGKVGETTNIFVGALMDTVKMKCDTSRSSFQFSVWKVLVAAEGNGQIRITRDGDESGTLEVS